MKKVFSVFILIIAMFFIVGVTVYTLKSKGTREEVEAKITKDIEKSTSNIGSNVAFDLYNIYLNKVRHKVKLEYRVVVDKEEQENLNLLVYFDGNAVLNIRVMEDITTAGIFEKDEFVDYVRMDDKALSIIKKDKDYLILRVKIYKNKEEERYFVLDNMGKNILDKGVIVRRGDREYVIVGENNIFYDEAQALAKIENGDLYVLEEITQDKNILLEEYRYSFKNGEVTKELLNTYENVTIKENTTKKK